ncbi:MAG: hypothetical protein FOGNACKC_01653 [Anaerolineae bacterium]|nr:hypothetical protein [Anaerolineae bacterium]
MLLPSININPNNRISVRRMLPVPGELLVSPGEAVNALTVVARAERPGGHRVIDLTRQFGQFELDMDEVLRVEAGEVVTPNTVLAAYRGGVSLLEKSVRAPAAGYVAAVGPGWILLETGRFVTEIQAFISGVVTRVLGNRGVIIEADGATVSATCGFGGEAVGRLQRLVNAPYEALTPDNLGENAKETIVLGGRTLDETTLRKADDWQVRGIIVGSIPAALLHLDPPARVRVVATEGFGDAPMSPYTFGLLTQLTRREVSIRGQTPGLTAAPDNPLSELPPVILAPAPLPTRGGYVGLSPAPKKEKASAERGSKVRVIQGRLLGASGTIDLIPPEPQLTEAGMLSPGAFVKLSNDVHFIPWANLELID